MSSSPSNPVGPSHNVPPTPPPPPGTSGTSGPSTPPPAATSWEDPTGAWQRFLSKGASPATPHDVEVFIGTLMKFFSQVILQQSNEAAKRASEQMKKTIEGDDN